MASMNGVIYLSSDEEDDKVVEHTDFFEGFSDEKPKRSRHRKSNSSDLTADDDDCVVLDGDPYKTTEKETTFDTCETDDEIVVVGQKGEIACRDFPHPRHACAKYPFKSTSHDKYCDMCHCYVCDIRAPCPHWCIGILTTDHCHANDKEKIWKNQREWIRTGKLLPPQSILSVQTSRYSPLNQLGIRACSASTMVASRPNTYIRPGYRPDFSRTFPQNPGLQPRAPQLFQNRSGGSNNGFNPRPQVISSNSFSRTERPSGGATLVDNSVHNIAQGSQYNRYATPPRALPGNPQQTATGYVSTVPSSHTNMYARKFSRKRRRTSSVSSGTPNPPAKQQQSGKSIDRVLSEIEDLLMDITTPTDPVCPLSGQVNSTTFEFDFETFFG